MGFAMPETLGSQCHIIVSQAHDKNNPVSFYINAIARLSHTFDFLNKNLQNDTSWVDKRAW